MPFVDVKVSSVISEDAEVLLKKRFGDLISIIPGKSEGSLMMNFEDQCRLWFRGSREKPSAFVNVMVYGQADRDACGEFAKEAAALLCETLDIPETNIYVKFEEVEAWFKA